MTHSLFLDKNKNIMTIDIYFSLHWLCLSHYYKGVILISFSFQLLGVFLTGCYLQYLLQHNPLTLNMTPSGFLQLFLQKRRYESAESEPEQ